MDIPTESSTKQKSKALFPSFSHLKESSLMGGTSFSSCVSLTFLIKEHPHATCILGHLIGISQNFVYATD